MNKLKVVMGYITCTMGMVIGILSIPITFTGACMEAFHAACVDWGTDLIVEGRLDGLDRKV